MKLFLRLYGYLILGISLLIAVAEFLSYRMEIQQYEADMIANAIQEGRSVSGMIAHVWKETGEAKALELLQDASATGTVHIRWQWLENIAAMMETAGEQQEKLERLGRGEAVSWELRNSDEMYRYTYVPVDIPGERQGALELSQPLVSFQAYSLKMLLRACLITIVLALFSGIVLYVFIDKKIGKPLGRIMAHAKRIGQGDFRTDTVPGGNDELAVTARTMNDMCSRLLIAKEKIRFEDDARLKTLDQLRHTEKLSSFGLISAGIAHELGTPLNVIDGRAKMILHEEGDENEIKECATIIKNQAERMTLAIRQLLDFTRRPTQHIAHENITLLIKQVFQLLYPMARKQHVHFSLHVEDDTEVIACIDCSRMQQVFVNLFMNSIQAMPQGGNVEVLVSNESGTASPREDSATDKFMKMRIRDEGEGIEQDHLDNIFTPFFTTKTIGTGTGLGLSIAHGIVEEHGGWIEVESKAHYGACFTVFLPMREEEGEA
jgi:two-component system, NtrC family, sensor kinase